MDYEKRIKEKGLKKKWLAEQVGIGRVLFSFYITGARPMPEHIEKKLKEILK